jgi:hypothetical protein
MPQVFATIVRQSVGCVMSRSGARGTNGWVQPQGAVGRDLRMGRLEACGGQIHRGSSALPGNVPDLLTRVCFGTDRGYV